MWDVSHIFKTLTSLYYLIMKMLSFEFEIIQR